MNEVSGATRTIRLALAQLNPTVGDFDANAEAAARAIATGEAAGADLIVLPELVITGYPPEDLLLKRHFIEAAEAATNEVVARTAGAAVAIGAPFRDPALHNGLVVARRGERLGSYAKVLLPNYGVFDERRYFEPGPGARLIELDGVRIGLTICEDIWLPGPPTSVEALAGAALVINASASPYHRGKGLERESMIAERARENGVAMALCNMVGGQDELVFDGHSVVIDRGGRTLARGRQFEEEVLLCDLELQRARDPEGGGAAGGAEQLAPVIASFDLGSRSRDPAPAATPPEPLHQVAAVYRALVVGLRDYVGKNGFSRVVLGLSGGIDSALVAEVAADALGAENVTCVIMPSPHSSAGTQEDARRIVDNLGAELIEIPIESMMRGYEQALAGSFAGTEPGVAEENLQARIRGNIVMALSNKFGWLPLSTGNKSEMSVGYATLYGDMAGGFAVIKDVPKTLVYELVRDRNELAAGELIPASVIDRAPSAELRPDQLDSDSLPPYEVLDAALEEYVEHDGGHASMVAAGIPPEVVDRVITLVDRAEYKRRQAPPGVKITTKAFGRDRRLPITNRFGG